MTEQTFHLWVVYDGEVHWVVAGSSNEAKRQVAEMHGYRLKDYEAEFEPSVNWAELTNPVRIDVTESVQVNPNDYPPGTRFFCELLPATIVEHMDGIVCSTAW